MRHPHWDNTKCFEKAVYINLVFGEVLFREIPFKKVLFKKVLPAALTATAGSLLAIAKALLGQ